MNKVYESTMGKASTWPSWSKDDRRELKEFAKQYHDLMGKLASAHKKGDAATAKWIAKQILCSFGAKVSVAVRTIKLAVVDGKVVGKEPSLAAVKEFAGTLDPYRPIPEPVFAEEMVKPGTELWSGGPETRVILKFKWGRKALQKMDDDILSVLHPASASDYMAAGKKGGREAAVKELIKLIDAGGFDYVVTIDTKNFFGAINKGRLADLLGPALPRKAVVNTLLINDDTKIIGKEKGLLSKGLPSTKPYVTGRPQRWCKARQGIPQGSLVSNRVGYAVVLGPLLRTLPFTESIVTFGDDVAFPAKGALEGENRLNAVMSLYATSPVGSLTIGRNKVSHVNDGFEFCGYWIRREVAWGGGWRLRPSDKAFRKWETQAIERYQKAGGGRAGWKAVYRYTRGTGPSEALTTKGWIHAFPLWKPRLWGPDGTWKRFHDDLWNRLSPAPLYGPFLPLEESSLQLIGEDGAST